MKKLNEDRFLHAKSRIYDNEFPAPSFPCHTQNYPLLLLLTPRIKDSLPFHQPTPFIIIPPQ